MGEEGSTGLGIGLDIFCTKAIGLVGITPSCNEPGEAPLEVETKASYGRVVLSRMAWTVFSRYSSGVLTSNAGGSMIGGEDGPCELDRWASTSGPVGRSLVKEGSSASQTICSSFNNQHIVGSETHEGPSPDGERNSNSYTCDVGAPVSL
jgi:hypothetical protein